MAKTCIDIEISVKCGECGAVLGIRRYTIGKNGADEIEVEVDVCAECLKEARDAGYEEGTEAAT